MKIGIAPGCFDLLHSDHIYLLTTAQRRCDTLYVALNTDESVRRLKGGGRPAETLIERLQKLNAHGFLNVVPFDTEDDFCGLLGALNVSTIFKGWDYRYSTVTGVGLMTGGGLTEAYFIKTPGGKSTTSILSASALHRCYVCKQVIDTKNELHRVANAFNPDTRGVETRWTHVACDETGP